MAASPSAYVEARSGLGGIGSAVAAAMAGSDMIMPWHMFMFNSSAFVLSLPSATNSTSTALWNGVTASPATVADWSPNWANFDGTPYAFLTPIGTDHSTGDYWRVEDTSQGSGSVVAFNSADVAMPFGTRPGFELLLIVVGPRTSFNLTSTRVAQLFEGSATV